MELGTADGLFNWAAWPWGNEDMNTYVDSSYLQYLDELPYMMPVSPWFFTNLPGYQKNWLWRGDHLWYDRWEEVLVVQPEFVEIITWNDYGESHYIGPLYDFSFQLFDIGEAPYNYAQNMPHDGWRLFLPYVIDMYKERTATITQEGLVGWYRLSPAAACGSGGTSGNTASQLQLEFEPDTMMQDSVFYSALLSSAADVTVQIGGNNVYGSWRNVPDGGIGIYHGSAPFDDNIGEVTITLQRGDTIIAQISNGEAIAATCTNDIENWNAWVGSASATDQISATPPLLVAESSCVNGTGAYNFNGLCGFSCKYGYCPIGACTCTALGALVEGPNATYPNGYRLPGEDASYSGLCSFDCSHGYCPDTACGTVSAPLSTPTVSDFSPPPACIGGSGEDNLAGLCSFSCQYGYCPINACNCTAEGPLTLAPTTVAVVGTPTPGEDPAIYSGLCSFACEHGYCPAGACGTVTPTPSAGSGIVFIGPEIWTEPDPIVQCEPPCSFVFPPLTLPTPTTIQPPLWSPTILHSFITTRTTTLANASTPLTIVGYSVTTSVIGVTLPLSKSSVVLLFFQFPFPLRCIIPDNGVQLSPVRSTYGVLQSGQAKIRLPSR
jgi:hypothetical protein